MSKCRRAGWADTRARLLFFPIDRDGGGDGWYRQARPHVSVAKWPPDENATYPTVLIVSECVKCV